MSQAREIFSLKGKTAVVIGGSGALGSAIARGLGDAGAEIAVTYRKGDVTALLEEFGDRGIKARAYPVDVMDAETVRACRDAIVKDSGRIDILVNVAGGNIERAMTTESRSFFDLDLDALKEVTWLNLFGGAIIPAQVFGRKMLENEEGGSIINISSMNAFRPLLGRPGYAAAKAAVCNFTRWLAVHIARECHRNIRVNAVAPGFFENARSRAWLYERDGSYSKRGEAIISHTPMKRLGRPDDLVGTVVWLASDASRFVTGVIVPVDGGFNAFSGV